MILEKTRCKESLKIGGNVERDGKFKILLISKFSHKLKEIKLRDVINLCVYVYSSVSVCLFIALSFCVSFSHSLSLYLS